MDKHLVIVNVDPDNGDYREIIQVSHPTKTHLQFCKDFARANKKARKAFEKADAFDENNRIILFPSTTEMTYNLLDQQGYEILVPEFSEVTDGE